MRAGGGEAAIESAIEDQVLLQVVREGKECTDGIGAGQRLGKMPNLSRGSETGRHRMRYRKRLAKLGAMLQSFNLFGHDCIGVKMESDGIETYQQQSRL